MRFLPHATAPRRAVRVVLTVVLAGTALLAPSRAQQMPFVVQAPDGAMHIWTVDEPTGMAVPEIEDVTFLSIRLVGQHDADRLRVGRPVQRGVDSPAPHVRLPSGGALYRVQSGAETGLLRVRVDGSPELLVAVPSDPAGPALDECVFVSADGRTAAVATTYDAGGDVVVVRLDEEAVTHVVTQDDPPHRIEGATLRASTRGVWFVASGELRRARPSDTSTAPVDFGLLRAEVLPDVVMNEWGTRVGAVVRFERRVDAESGDRHVFAVEVAGAPVRVTEDPADYDVPSSAHGPLMAFNPRGDRLAWRRADRAHEILVRRLPPVEPAQRVRGSLPDADGSASALRALHFLDSDELWFVEAGSTAWSCRLADGGPVTTPFELGAGLHVDEVLFDPDAERLFLVADRPSVAAPTWELYEADPDAPTLDPVQHLKGLRVRPELVGLGSSVVVVTGRPVGEPPEDAADVDLHVEVLERTLPGAPPLLMLYPDQTHVELGRFAVSPNGNHASFVVGTGGEHVMPTYLDLRTGGLKKASEVSLAVSPVLAFSSSGSLLVGLGHGRGGYTFGAFRTPKDGKVTVLPKSYGFPLQH